ncbi:MAG: glycosyl transferase family protein [Pseudonocardiales bacterium]|nr:glycosyl transferase family protein [Pseudonocardiales bacterium]
MTAPLLLIAHPSPDLYGSDRQLLETIDAVTEAGWRTLVLLPAAGPLIEALRARGAEVEVSDFPVLRKSLLTPRGLVTLALKMPLTALRLRRQIRELQPAAVYVNTVTIPVWPLAARLARVPVLGHVHEAEEDQRAIIRKAMAVPLFMADEILVNSAAARKALTDVLPRLDRRITVVHNGVPTPDVPASPARSRVPGDPARIALVGRLSPRKGIDVALDAVGLLQQQGRDVDLIVCGTVFPGYEWYEEELRERAARPDLAGHVELAGYVHPTWPVLADADLVLVPSRVEPFGNAAVEGLLARRPVIASGVQGLAEVIVADRTGLLVEPGDAAALAAAIGSLLDDPARSDELAAAGHADAEERFSLKKYRAQIVAALQRVRT